MSMSQNGSNGSTTADARREANRARWNHALAHYTLERRQELGLTVAQAAELSGLEISQWYALESGWATDDMNTLRAIAATLQVDYLEYSGVAFLTWACQQAR